jgi:predicted TIM-barrel fold metal-dependent hydrolase
MKQSKPAPEPKTIVKEVPVEKIKEVPFPKAYCPQEEDWKALKEAERCIKDLGSFGMFITGMYGIPANDKMWWPFYDLCQDAGVPVKISVGATAGGAGQGGGSVGGMGIRLSTEKPIPNIDDVAAAFPNLTIIGHHYPFPWVDEMTAVMIHKTMFTVRCTAGVPSTSMKTSGES